MDMEALWDWVPERREQGGGECGWWFRILTQLGLLQQETVDGLARQQVFIPHSSGGLKSEIKGASMGGSGESSLPGLHTAAFYLCPHMEQEGELAVWSLLTGH